MSGRFIHYFSAVLLILSVSNTCHGFSDTNIVTSHIEIFHEGVGKHYAETAAQSAERHFMRITRTLGHTPHGRLSIILTRDEGQFRELTRGAIPDWSAAVALPGNRIVISPLAGQKIEFERILSHEIVHCVINDAAGELFVPRWFHEGCAETLSGSWGIHGKLYMVWNVSRGKLLNFSDIQHIFSANSTDATLAYDQSMLAVSHLTSIYGEQVLSMIIAGIKSGIDFPRAFQNATGLWPSEFEKDYIRYISKAYGRRSLITLVPGTWTIIMIVAILVYIVKRHQSRKLLRHWEDIEGEDNIIDFTTFPPDKD